VHLGPSEGQRQGPDPRPGPSPCLVPTRSQIWICSPTLTLTRVQNQTQNGVWTIAVKALCNCISPGPDPSPNSQLESRFVSGSLLAPCGPSEGDIVLHGPSTVSMATWHHAVHLRSKGVYSSLSAWCCGIVQFLCTSKGC